MLSQTFKLEITTTANESEAFTLEANLIKKHKPKFNILLKMINHFHLYLLVTKINGHKLQSIEAKKIKKDFILGHLHLLEQQIGQ